MDLSMCEEALPRHRRTAVNSGVRAYEAEVRAKLSPDTLIRFVLT